MNRFVLALSRLFLISLVSLVVLAAVLVGLGRQLLSHVHEAHAEIETYLSENSGLDIRFDQIEGRWKKLTPHIQLNQLRIKAPEKAESFLSVNEIKAEINLGTSFLYLRPIIKLWVDGLALDAVYADGNFTLKNAPEVLPEKKTIEDRDNDKLFDQIDFLLKQPHIQISNSHISIQGFWQQEVKVADINIGMARKGVSKRFWADLVLAGESDITVKMKGDVRGRFSDRESLEGRLYAKLNAPALASWMPIPLADLTAMEVSESSGEIEVWSKLSSGAIERVTSRFNLSDVVVRKEGSDISPPKLNRVKGVAKWQGDWDRDWIVGLRSFEIDGEDFHWAPQRLVVHSKKMATNERRYIGQVDNATVLPWVRYYASFLDPESRGFKTLNQVQPEAALDNVVFDVDVIDKSVADFNVAVDISDLTLQPKRWIPGLNNVSAKALIGKYVSVFELQGKNIDLNYPALFRDPIVVDELKGDLLFHNSIDEWVLESGLLEINDLQLNAVTQLAVIKDKLSENSPYLRLQSTLRNLDVTNDLYAHLPVGVIPDGVERWIDGAVKNGSLLRGDLLFHGPTDLYEFEPFQYVLGFVIDDLTIQYLPDWKPVQGITTDVRLYSGRVDAWALSGQYYNANLDNTWIGTGRNVDDDLELTVDAKLKGRLENALQILVDSPIKESTASIMDAISVEGDGDIGVTIKVPFREEESDKPPLSLAVNVDVNNGIFDLVGNDLTITNLTGHVDYDLEEGLSSPGVSGELFNGSLKAIIETKADGEHQQTIVKGSGRTAMEYIKPWLKLDLLEPLNGEFNYSANVAIRKEVEGDKAPTIHRSSLDISSDLVGVDVDYPAPFRKAKSVALPFKYVTSLGGFKQYQKVTLDNLFDLQMVSDSGGMSRGAIAFGEPSELPSETHFTIAGNIAELDLPAWKQAYAGIGQARTGYGLEERSSSLLNELGPSTLTIGALTLNGQQFNDMSVALNQEGDNVFASIDAKELQAAINLPVEYLGASEHRSIDKPIDVHVRRLAINIEGNEAPSSDAAKDDIDPRILPPVDLKIDQLELSGDQFGSWQVNWRPTNTGVNFKNASFAFKNIRFEGDGDWQWKNDHSETAIKGKATTKNVADVLKSWGYAKSITSKKAFADIEGGWPGAPFEFDLMKANAHMELVIKDGRFREVSSGTADKVLGFLNFDDWLKRLQLKIKDLDSNEMPFSSIRGDFVLKDKVLSSKELTIDSAAMNMEMAGELNLERQHIKADLDVAIPVTRNLVLPAAAVGGLPAAATVYVIEKVLGSQLDKLTTMKYTVEGPFEDPVVALKESFNIIPKQIQESIVTNGESETESKPEVDQESEAKPVQVPEASHESEPTSNLTIDTHSPTQ